MASSRQPRQVDTVKGENTQLRDENNVLKDYGCWLCPVACNCGLLSIMSELLWATFGYNMGTEPGFAKSFIEPNIVAGRRTPHGPANDG